MRWTWAVAGVVAGLVVGGPGGPAVAQRLLDWPIRAGAGSEALLAGAASAFWNPAGVVPDGSRGEALVLDLKGPSAVGIGGVAVAGVVVPWRGVVGFLGYNHLAVAGIRRTEDSPLADSLAPEVDVSEDRVVVGAARALGEEGWVGVALHYGRESVAGSGDGGLAAGVGVVYRPRARWAPAVSGAVFAGRAEPRWLVGVEAAPAVGGEGGVRVGASYGLSGGAWPRAPSHRVALVGRRGRQLSVAFGLDVEPGAREVAWAPVASATLRLGRYRLTLVRDELANGFGAAYAYGLHVTF